jgi:hypothetical protein
MTDDCEKRNFDGNGNSDQVMVEKKEVKWVK